MVTVVNKKVFSLESAVALGKQVLEEYLRKSKMDEEASGSLVKSDKHPLLIAGKFHKGLVPPQENSPCPLQKTG